MADPVVFKNCKVAFTTATATGTYTEVSGVKSVEMPFSKAELGNSVMGDNAETFFPGLISAPVTVAYRQDFTTGGVDDVFWTRWNSETKFRMRVIPVDTTVSASNPAYQFTGVFISSITPVSGSHGQLLENSVQLRMLSGCVLSRQTSS